MPLSFSGKIAISIIKTSCQNGHDESLNGLFQLKRNGKINMRNPRRDSIASTINHLVQERAQLTVDKHLNDIRVPTTYGPTSGESGC